MGREKLLTLLRVRRITNPLLLIALGFLIGGFIAINKYGEQDLPLENQTVQATQYHHT